MALPIWALLAGAQGLYGLFQNVQAANRRKRAERNFDKYQVPSSVFNMLDIAHGMSSQTEVPGADILRSRAKSYLAETGEKATRVSQSPVDALGAIQQMFGSYLGFEQDLAAKGLEMQRQAKLNEMNVLGKIGEYQSQAWVYNELYPYMQQMTGAGQLAQAGGTNINSALSAGLNLGMADWDINNQEKMFQNWRNSVLGTDKEMVNVAKNFSLPYGSKY